MAGILDFYGYDSGTNDMVSQKQQLLSNQAKIDGVQNEKIEELESRQCSGAVISVNGKIGNVILDADDIGAATAEQGMKADTAYQKPSNGIPTSDLASGVQSSLTKADTAYQKSSNGIPKTDLASGVQTSLGKADAAYQKPSNGIPATDLASGVQTSLGKADTAIQEVKTINGNSIVGTGDINITSQTYVIDNTPTYDSNNLVTSGGVQKELALGAVWDVSEHNSLCGTTFESLSVILNSPNLDALIPTDVRKGGMQIKFVQSIDNNYVQFRYMPSDAATAATFTNVANWQGVDSQLIVESKNLVESGTVYKELYGDATDVTLTLDVTAGTGISIASSRTPLQLMSGRKYKITFGGNRSNGTQIVMYLQANSSDVQFRISPVESSVDTVTPVSQKTITSDITTLWCIPVGNVDSICFYAPSSNVKDTGTLTYRFESEASFTGIVSRIENLEDNIGQVESIGNTVNGDILSKSYEATSGVQLNTSDDPIVMDVQSGKEVYIEITCDKLKYVRVSNFYIKVNNSWQGYSYKPIIGIKGKYVFENDVQAFAFNVAASLVTSNMSFCMTCCTRESLSVITDEQSDDISQLKQDVKNKADLYQESINLFDPESQDIVVKKYIDTNGVIADNNGYMITQPFLLMPGESIVSNTLGSGTKYALFEDGTLTKPLVYSVSNSSPYLLTNISDKPLYARFSLRMNDTNVMINRGVVSLNYQPYTGYLKTLNAGDIVSELGGNSGKAVSQSKITEVLGSDAGGDIVYSEKLPTVAGEILNTYSIDKQVKLNVKAGTVLYFLLIGSESNVNAETNHLYYKRANGAGYPQIPITGYQGYVSVCVVPEDATEFFFYSGGTKHSDGWLQMAFWTDFTISQKIKNLYLKNYTLDRVVREWIRGEKCPIAFIGDSTTDGVGTTGWTVSGSHRRQDARNWLEDHPEFMPDATEEEREQAASNAGYGVGSVDYIWDKSYPYILEKKLQKEFSNNSLRVYNLGYSGLSLSKFREVEQYFTDVYADTKMAGIVLGINDRIANSSYGDFYVNILRLLETYVLRVMAEGIVPFMVTSQIVTQSGHNPNVGSGVADSIYNDDVQSITNKAKREVAEKYGLEIIDLNRFTQLLLTSSNYRYTDLTEDIHFHDLGHILEAGYLFKTLVPWVNTTDNADKLYVGFNGWFNKSDFCVGKFDEFPNNKFKRQINYTRSETTDICIFDSYVFNNSVNGVYSVKYFTPTASGYIVIDEDTDNPIIINNTEMNLDPWDIGLHHVQVYTGESTTVAFTGFLLEQAQD